MYEVRYIAAGVDCSTDRTFKTRREAQNFIDECRAYSEILPFRIVKHTGQYVYVAARFVSSAV